MEVISLLCKNFFWEQQSKLLSGKEKRQKATLVPIKCPMLTTKSMFQIVDFYAEKCGAEKTDDEHIWKLCNLFLLILWDTGGLPRALQFMLSTCCNKLNKNGKAFFHNIKDQDFDKIFKETTITLEENMAYTKAYQKMSWLSTKPTSRNTLVTFYLAEDINPNFSELTKIKNIVPDVGVVTADKIIEE
ncbi:hypothetical protein RhiirA5_419469 [Rhizophagus irregularis]|nr:hypothetical protein RhiirA5_419469 [Rhizophagus irregularis]